MRLYSNVYINNLHATWDLIEIWKWFQGAEWQYVVKFRDQNVNKWLNLGTKMTTNW